MISTNGLNIPRNDVFEVIYIVLPNPNDMQHHHPQNPRRQNPHRQHLRRQYIRGFGGYPHSIEFVGAFNVSVTGRHVLNQCAKERLLYFLTRKMATSWRPLIQH